MNNEIIALEIIAAVGGNKNIKSVTHCATRLRFNLNNESLVNSQDIERIEAVIGSSLSGGQYQLIIGNNVSNIYIEIENLIDQTNNINQIEPVEGKSLKGFVNKIFDVLSGTFIMFIPALIAAGMISAFLAVLTSFNLVSMEDPTYLVFSSVQAGIFYFLPIFAGYSAASKLNMNPFIGMALGAILCYPGINDIPNLSIFGIGVPQVMYSSTVFPIILGVTLMSYVERVLKKIVPGFLQGIITPMVTLLVGFVATILVLGPIGSMLGIYLSELISIISSKAGWLAPSVIALIYPIMIFTGMHYSLIPLVMTSFATIGFDPLLMVAGFISNLAESAAALATSILLKDKKKKADTLAISISAMCGVTEPALFGVTLRNKKTLVAVCLGGFSGALFGGIFSMKAYGFVGGLPSLPLFIDPNGGFNNFIITIIAVLISFTVTFILTLILNKGVNQNEL